MNIAKWIMTMIFSSIPQCVFLIFIAYFSTFLISFFLYISCIFNVHELIVNILKYLEL